MNENPLSPRSLLSSDSLNARSGGLHPWIAPWPARVGFYVAEGTMELVGAVQDALTLFLQVEASTDVPSGLGPVYWIDSGNLFNPYRLADTVRRRGGDPKQPLRQIKVARPFTAFQLQMMLDKIPSPALLEPSGSSPNTARVPLVIVSDLMGLFYDSEIQDGDLRRAFREFLKKLMRLKNRAVVLGLHLIHEVPPNRAALASRVLSLADRVEPAALPSASAAALPAA